MLQPGLWRLAWRGRLLGVLIADVAQVETDAGQQVRGLGDGLGRIAEQAQHLGGRLQPAFAVGVQAPASRLDRDAFADTGQHVLQVTLDRVVIEDVVDRQQRGAALSRQRLQPRQPPPVIAAPTHGGAQPDRTGRGLGQTSQHTVKSVQPGVRHDDQQQILRRGDQVTQPDLAMAFHGPPVAQGQKPRQPPPTRPRLGIGDDVGRSVVEGQARPGRQFEVCRPSSDLLRQGGIVQRILDIGHLAGPRAVAHHIGRRQAVLA